jgi:hypothetical protein
MPAVCITAGGDGTGRPRRGGTARPRRPPRCRPAAVGIDAPPYRLRHSLASLLLHEGKSSAYVARQIGDSIRVTLDAYTHVIDGLDPDERVTAVEAIEAARGELDVRGECAEPEDATGAEAPEPASTLEADARTRIGDPVITSEVGTASPRMNTASFTLATCR